MSNNNNEKGKNWYIERLWRKPSGWWMFGIPVGGLAAFVVGIIFWVGFNASLEATSTLEFCAESCHEMNIAFEEYKEHVHYKNASGVQAVCSDCHIPKPWIAKMVRKTESGIKDVYHKILGTIDTPEKYEAHRLEMASDVWAEMKENDSLECRSCHNFTAMDLEKQDKSAAKKHSPERQQEKHETCIDCHKGIAHKLPEDYEGD